MNITEQMMALIAERDELRTQLEEAKRIIKGWAEWHRLVEDDPDDLPYLNGKAWDDAEALADMSGAFLQKASVGDLPIQKVPDRVYEPYPGAFDNILGMEARAMSDLVEQMKRVGLMLPIRTQNGQDYAEAFGQDFQAMTMTPDRFEALNGLPQWIDYIAALEAENLRMREALRSLLTDWHDCMGHRGTKGECDAIAALGEGIAG